GERARVQQVRERMDGETARVSVMAVLAGAAGRGEEVTLARWGKLQLRVVQPPPRFVEVRIGPGLGRQARRAHLSLDRRPQRRVGDGGGLAAQLEVAAVCEGEPRRDLA